MKPQVLDRGEESLMQWTSPSCVLEPGVTIFGQDGGSGEVTDWIRTRGHAVDFDLLITR